MKRLGGDGRPSPGDVEMRLQPQKDALGSGDSAESAAPQHDSYDPEPGSAGISPVTEECLADVEAELCDDDHCTPAQRAMTENVACRRADHEIITALKACNFEGPLYDYVATELAAYALAVLMAWMRTGEIFRKCREKGRPVPPTEIWRWDRDDRLGLAHLTVAKALAVFRERVLVPGTWDHRRGATLKTFFVGACLLQFANYFNECTSERRRWGSPELHELLNNDASSSDLLPEDHTERDPAVVAATNDRFRQVFKEMPDGLRRASKMISEGHSYEEAAAAIGISAEALGARFRRFRNRHGKGGGDV